MGILDEIAFMKDDTLYDGVFPVCQENQACMIGLTTPGSADQIVSKIIHARDDDGLPIFHVVRIGSSCDECRELMIECVHKENAAAEGTSRKKRARYTFLYTGEALKAKFQTEFFGVETSSRNRIVSLAYLNRLKRMPVEPVPQNVDMLFMAIDPALGGDNEWACIGSYFDRKSGRWIICLVDSFRLPNSGQPIKDAVRNSIVGLVNLHKTFKACPIVICVESAPRNIPVDVLRYAEEIQRESNLNITVMKELRDGSPGVLKTPGNTKDMAFMLRKYFYHDAVRFSAVFNTTVNGATKESAAEALFEHIGRLAVIRDPKNPDNARISGKHGSTENDDLGVAAMMSVYWHIYFWESNKDLYQRAKESSLGWRRPDEIFKIREYDPENDPEALQARLRLFSKIDPEVVKRNKLDVSWKRAVL